jgi:hypothetical protein
MNHSYRLFLSAALATVALSALRPAAAQQLFFDDFEGDGPARLSATSLLNWNVGSGTVDVIGNGSNDVYPGNGLYLDMDGSSGDAARIETKTTFNLTPGDYVLAFSQGKNGTNAESMNISVGSVFSTIFGSPQGADALTPRSFNFTVASATTGTIVFDHAGGDNQGLTVDNVRLTRVVVVPEANTFALALPTLGMLGAVLVRRRKK